MKWTHQHHLNSKVKLAIKNTAKIAGQILSSGRYNSTDVKNAMTVCASWDLAPHILHFLCVLFILPLCPQLSCQHLMVSSEDGVGWTARVTHGKPSWSTSPAAKCWGWMLPGFPSTCLTSSICSGWILICEGVTYKMLCLPVAVVPAVTHSAATVGMIQTHQNLLSMPHFQRDS